MATPYINPLGFVDKLTDEGATFILTNAEDSSDMNRNTPLTVWRFSPENLAMAKIRGVISAVGYTTATLSITDSHMDPRWPDGHGILHPGIPVYLALPDSYEPDPSRMLSQGETDAILRESARYRESSNNGVPQPPGPTRENTLAEE